MVLQEGVGTRWRISGGSSPSLYYKSHWAVSFLPVYLFSSVPLWDNSIHPTCPYTDGYMFNIWLICARHKDWEQLSVIQVWFPTWSCDLGPAWSIAFCSVNKHKEHLPSSWRPVLIVIAVVIESRSDSSTSCRCHVYCSFFICESQD